MQNDVTLHDLLARFEKDIVEFAQVPDTVANLDPRTIGPKLQSSLDAIRDGTIDPGDADAFAQTMMELFGPNLVADEKRRVAVLKRLRDLYDYLETAPDEEWLEYMSVLQRARAESTLKLFLKFAPATEH